MKPLETRDDPASNNSAGVELSLRHLEAELARMDVLLRRQVRRWQQAGQDPSDAFRGLYVSDGEASALLKRPIGAGWGEAVTLDRREEQAFDEELREATLQAKALAEAARCQGHPVRLVQLSAAFALDSLDMDILLLCLAPALDLRYERLYGYLQDDVTRKRPSVNLALDLLCPPGIKRLALMARFADEGTLLRCHLVERLGEPGATRPPLLAQGLIPDEAVVSWLLGRYQPHADLAQHARLTTVSSPADSPLLDPAQREALQTVLDLPGDAPLVIFRGPDTLSQDEAARRLAGRARRPLLTVDLAAAIESGAAPLRVVQMALRDGRLTGAIPYLCHWDACLVEGAAPPGLLAELYAYPGLVIAGGQAPWLAQGIARTRPLSTIAFATPPFGQRRILWEHYLGATSAEQTDGPEVDAVASQFILTAGQIRDAVATARDLAMQRGEPLCSDDLLAAARAHSNPHLASLARKIAPRYDWEDIVLPADQVALLRELVATVRGRPLVLEEWGLGRKLVSGQGVTTLFAGPPGTGKTMAAEIIAGELGLDLYKIDLSTVVSKYIGETEKNLERIFAEAESSNAILFFDEADALFGKRSEVRDSHDRYANIEISYLLQRMEAYDGVTILATNLRANLDDAFTRRLQFAVDFPFPEEQDRLRIWQTLFPPDVPREPDLDFGQLARRFKLAGGSIRNIIVSAAYLAASDGQCVSMGMMLHSTRRELQKMGRLVSEDHMTSQEG
jgi:hypothetical protein